MMSAFQKSDTLLRTFQSNSHIFRNKFAREAKCKPRMPILFVVSSDIGASILEERRKKLNEVVRNYYEVVWTNMSESQLQDIMVENHIQQDLSTNKISEGRDRIQLALQLYHKLFDNFRVKVLESAVAQNGESAFVHFQISGIVQMYQDEEGNLVEENRGEITLQGLSRLFFNEEGKIDKTLVFRELYGS
eukprot:TRINITY_DN9934_c0_g1_i1.p1 TRINITY_DN9934_c0_g1~~TRINITY_DN9934_c0_g1_i1.p1  ORF type:complete len:219 (-),score=11.67 TRINITY_DN9934_c0_g1_i1:260-829(-)